MARKRIQIGRLFEIEKPGDTRVIHSLTQGNDPRGTTFGAWPIRRDADGNWQLYGYGASVGPQDVRRWLGRLSRQEMAEAARRGRFRPDETEHILRDYDISRRLPEG